MIIRRVMTWKIEQEMGTITALTRETMILVPLGLPFFVPFAVANRTGLSFWTKFVIGVLLASLTIRTMVPDRSAGKVTSRCDDSGGAM